MNLLWKCLNDFDFYVITFDREVGMLDHPGSWAGKWKFGSLVWLGFIIYLFYMIKFLY